MNIKGKQALMKNINKNKRKDFIKITKKKNEHFLTIREEFMKN